MPRYVLQIAALLLLTASLGMRVNAAPPELTADTLSHESTKLIADGNAHLISDKIELKADRITYDTANKIASAVGNVQITHFHGRLLSKSVSYHAGTEEIESATFRLGHHPLFVTGESVDGTKKKISARKVHIFHGEPSALGLNIKSKKITFESPDKIKMMHTRFRIGKMPFFYLPYFAQSQKDKAMNIKLSAGSRDNLGPYVQSELSFPSMMGDTTPGILADFYGKRGYMIGPTLHYSTSDSTDQMQGKLTSGWIDDRSSSELRGTDRLRRNIEADRHFLEWRHKQHAADRLDITASVSWWNDSEILRDFRDDLYYNNQEPDSFFETAFRGKNYIISAFARIRPNDFQTVHEKVPELRIDYFPTPIFNTGFYQEFQLSAARLFEKDPQGVFTERESDRADLYYGWRRSIPLAKWLTASPVAGTRITHYKRTEGARDNYTRFLGQVGLDVESSIHRTWNYKNDFWGIDGLRHVVKPIVQYRYIPKTQHGNDEIPPIERRTFTTLLPPIDLANVRDLDEINELNVIRYGLRNVIETRHGDYGSRDLARFDFLHEYRFATQNTQPDYSDIHTVIDISPAHWFDFGIYNRFTPEHLTNTETRTQLRIKDADSWMLGISTDNLQNTFDQYYLDFSLKLAENHRFEPRWRYDSFRKELVEQLYGFRSVIGNSWNIEYAVSFLRGDRREDGIGFTIRFDLLDF